MTPPVNPLPQTDQLTREAIAWLVRLKSGEATVEDGENFKAWRSSSPDHEQAFRKVVTVWRGLENVAKGPDQDATVTSLPRPMLRRRAFLAGAAAAAAASTAVAVVHPPLSLWPSWHELLADYRTGKGELRRVTVSREVSVELGTLTSLSVRWTPETPSIVLIAGEAAFTANMGANRLTVLAADGRISASQASFNTRCIDAAVSVTCAEGEVEVAKNGTRVLLRKGQRVAYADRGLGSVLDADLAQATAWQSGMLTFDNRPLKEVVDEINRYRPGRIIITNAELGRRIVNGSFRQDQLGAFVAQVQQLFGAKVVSLPAGLTLLD